MSFEDRVRFSVDQALSTLVKQVVDEAADERDGLDEVVFHITGKAV